jgi:hypothetical protein
MATEAPILANQQNSPKSSDCKPIDEKRRSRARSIVHGLCASAVVIESLELVQRRAWECFEGLRPQDSYQARLVNLIAILTLRLDRSGGMERRARDKVVLRACLSWDEDRNLEAKALAGKLAASPEVVVEGLRRTPQGCDWLIDRWSRLADAARDSGGSWTDSTGPLKGDGTRQMFDTFYVFSAFYRGPGMTSRPEGDLDGTKPMAWRNEADPEPQWSVQLFYSPFY